MSDTEDKIGYFKKFLNYRHTGKLITIITTALYGILSYIGSAYLRGWITGPDKTEQSIGIILLLALFGLLGWVRDVIIDLFDMQSTANKERLEHTRTKRELSEAQGDVLECRRIIHAIRTNINNTMIQNADNDNKIKKIADLMVKVNMDYKVNNVIDLQEDNKQKDYMAIFSEVN